MKVYSVAVIAVLVLAWLLLYRNSRTKYQGCREMKMDGLRLQLIAPPMLLLLEKLRVSQRSPIFFFKIQRSVQKISGDKRGGEYTLLFLAEMLSYGWLILIAGSLFSLLLGEDPTVMIFGAFLAVLIPIALARDLHQKVVKREREIILELPELLNKIVLLVGAGLTVQQAIKRCLERKAGAEQHPLYRELFRMQREWESGYSFHQAMEGVSKRLGVQEVSAFVTSVLLNYRRGGNDFVLALMDLSHTLWERRKAVSKTLGEQASSKLVFPMLMLFLIIVVMVGAPALMIMEL
ncbi:type II secretion system F family protein [Paenibacillus lutimineralis]|uniref:Type II secretion protein F n=1 Tax=Paenibacillus lutimineralis TaxID=2707005 RepID=A0A3S9V393_9BACL|nr:type II secretion system F family protein [Paenibacillus lutimineralis]AZS16857.1 type II secretion protein F [Paenibacillus lutimineralis]